MKKRIKRLSSKKSILNDINNLKINITYLQTSLSKETDKRKKFLIQEAINNYQKLIQIQEHNIKTKKYTM